MIRLTLSYNTNAIEIISLIEKAPVGFEPAGAFFSSGQDQKTKLDHRKTQQLFLRLKRIPFFALFCKKTHGIGRAHTDVYRFFVKDVH